MKKVQWKVWDGQRLIDMGTVTAETDREALGLVLAGELDLPLEPNKSYRIEAGELTMSSFGDEFRRSAESTIWAKEPALENGQHTFAPPPITELPQKDPFEEKKPKEKVKLAYTPEKTYGVRPGEYLPDCGGRGEEHDWHPDITSKSILRARCRKCGKVEPWAERSNKRCRHDQHEFAEYITASGKQAKRCRKCGALWPLGKKQRPQVHTVPQRCKPSEHELETSTSGKYKQCRKCGVTYPAQPRKGGPVKNGLLDSFIEAAKAGDRFISNHLFPKIDPAGKGQDITVQNIRAKGERIGRITFPSETAEQRNARHTMDRYVREINQRREHEARARGCAVEDIDVEFVHDEARFTYNPKR